VSDRDTLLGNSYYSNFIASFDLNGNHIWSKRFLSSNNNTRIRRIDISQNGYYFGGYFQGNLTFDIGTITSYTPNAYDAFIYKTDFNGNGQWVRRIRGQNTENFRTLTTDEYDNVYVLGNYNSPTIYIDSTETITKAYTGNSGGYDTYIAKYNRSGVLKWFIRKGSTAKDIYNDFVVRNNLIYTTGYFANQIIFNNDTLHTDNPLNEDAFLAAFNEIGDAIAGVSIQGTGNYNDAGTIVNMDASSRAYVSGYYRSQEIKIGDQTYTSNNINKSDLFFAIYQHPFKAVITDEQMVTCYGLSDGMLEVTPYFGRPPYTYSWSHNASLAGPLAENLPAGDYTVTVTDANNNHASISKTITQPLPLEINGTITPVSCYNGDNGAIDLTVTGGTKSVDYIYNWTTLNGSGLVPLNQDQSGLTDGTYTIYVEDDNSCNKTMDFVVTHPARINFKGSVVTPVTIPPGNNGAVDLSVNGGNAPYTFAWTGPESFSASTEDLTNLGLGGLYNLHLTDDKACTSDTSFAIVDGTTLVAEISGKTDVLCYGQNNGSVTVTVYDGLPPYSYQWSDQGTPTLLNTRTGMAPGIYYLLVSDAATPTPHTAPASVEIVGPANDLHLVLYPQNLRCYQDNSGVIDLSVTGGTYPYQYSWSNGYTGEDLLDVASGLYTVTVTDGNNCTAIGNETTLTEPPLLALDIEITNAILCHGDNDASLTANASGGNGSISYLWDDPGTQVTKTAYELSAGNYKVIITDENGCTKTSSILLPEPDSLYVEVILNNPSCPGLSDGSIIPTPVGGTGPDFEYIWSNNVFERFNTNIPAGNYTLTLNDDNGCTIFKEFNLFNPDTVKITSVDITNPACADHSDGSITINASGGSGLYEYSADGGLTFLPTSTIGSLAQGTYTVQVRDENECSSFTEEVTLFDADTVKITSVDITDLTCSGHYDGSISINVSGGTGIYEYSTDGGLTFVSTSTIGSLAKGNYTVQVRDDNDCYSENYPVTLTKPITCGLIIYDAFSPNNDGMNDVWNIGNLDNFPAIKVKIFNIWGTPVFSSNGYGTPWDGTHNGHDLPSGTYYYVIDPGDGSDALTGAVSIVK
jgi:gliding motility-associated-like protein